MMKARRKRYTSEFRQRSPWRLIKGQRTVNEIGTRYGLHSNQVSQWKKQALEQLPDVFSDGRARKEKSEEELREQLYPDYGNKKENSTPTYKFVAHPVLTVN